MLAQLQKNDSIKKILINMVIAALSLFVNGFGVYLTIHANIGASPWDIFNLGLSHTFGIKYGTASIIVSFIILFIDILMREPIGIAMFIDAVVVGKTVDLFNYLDIVPAPAHPVLGALMCILGLFIIGYTQATYMFASLGCGPRDTLLVGLKKRLPHIPIGVVSIALLSSVTLIGYLLGGRPVGVGTLICAFLAGPIMQLALVSLKIDATLIHHQRLQEAVKVIFKK